MVQNFDNHECDRRNSETQTVLTVRRAVAY